jgi:hypothetical protein
MRARVLALGALLGASLGARQTSAAELSGLSLTWVAPADCPDQAALLTRVGELVGEHGGAQTHEPLDVLASVTPRDGEFVAELRTTQRGTERTRVLEAGSCTELTEASAVVIALALSPPEEPAPPAPAVTSVPPAPRAPLADEPQPPDTAVRRSGTRLGTGAGFVTDFGTLAPVAAGFVLGIGGRYGRYLEHGIRVSIFPNRSSTVEGHPEQGVNIGLVAAGLSLCVEPFTGQLALSGCGVIELGMLHVEGFGTPTRYSHDAPWVAPGLGLRGAYPERGPFRVAMTADALFPTEQTKFTITNLGVAHELPVVAGRLGLLAELIFL